MISVYYPSNCLQRSHDEAFECITFSSLDRRTRNTWRGQSSDEAAGSLNVRGVQENCTNIARYLENGTK